MDNPKINIRAWKPVEKRKSERVEQKNEEKQKNEDKQKSLYLVKTNQDIAPKTAPKPAPTQEDLLERLEAVNNDDIIFVDNHSKFTLIEKESDDLPVSDKSEASTPKYNIEIIDEKMEESFKNRFPSLIRKGDTFSNSYHEEPEYSTPPRKKNKRISIQFKSQLLKTVAAGVGAIITGMVIGTLLLIYFVNPLFGEKENTTINNPLSAVGQGNSESAALTIDEQVIYVLQAGVFSDRVGAETALTEHKKNGLNGIIVGNGPFHLFLGMTMNKENGLSLANALKEKGIEIYVKDYPIGSLKGEFAEGTHSAFSKWLLTGNQLVATLAGQIGETISTNKNAVDFAVIQKQHQQFLLDTQALTPLLKQDQLTEHEKIVSDMVKQMNISIQAVAAYQKNTNSVYLWDIEAGLLNYKVQYQNLMEL